MIVKPLPEPAALRDVPAEMIGFAAQRLTELETEGVCGGTANAAPIAATNRTAIAMGDPRLHH